MNLTLPARISLMAFVVAGAGIFAVAFIGYNDASGLLRQQSIDRVAVDLLRLSMNSKKTLIECA
ncbi:MAG: hypothetical protein HOM11_00505 [Methylococcales bacterium]|jgi:hypothetical protein|nr:hypothetical protein [Methylococcales bacterium]MBT7444668.1 hypothetical protein [Methylococcales bacterium]